MSNGTRWDSLEVLKVTVSVLTQSLFWCAAPICSILLTAIEKQPSRLAEMKSPLRIGKRRCESYLVAYTNGGSEASFSPLVFENLSGWTR